MKENLLIGLSTLIIGWILGILSNVINDRLKRKSSKRDVIIGIQSELTELQIHLSSVSLRSVCLSGEFNKEFFDWVKPYFLNSFKSADSVIPKEMLNKIPDITKLEDETLFTLMKTALERAPNQNNNSTFTYQNISIPFIDSKITEISLLNVEVQQLLFVLKRDTNFLNNDIDQIWFFNSKTYNEPSEKNLAILNTNIFNLYSRIGRRSKTVVNNIDKILELIKNLSK
jgi:hypothetical protein